MFYVTPRINTKALEEMLRVRVIRRLVAERKLAKVVATRLIASSTKYWRHRGFSVHNGEPVKVSILILKFVFLWQDYFTA